MEPRGIEPRFAECDSVNMNAHGSGPQRHPSALGTPTRSVGFDEGRPGEPVPDPRTGGETGPGSQVFEGRRPGALRGVDPTTHPAGPRALHLGSASDHPTTDPVKQLVSRHLAWFTFCRTEQIPDTSRRRRKRVAGAGAGRDLKPTEKILLLVLGALAEPDPAGALIYRLPLDPLFRAVGVGTSWGYESINRLLELDLIRESWTRVGRVFEIVMPPACAGESARWLRYFAPTAIAEGPHLFDPGVSDAPDAGDDRACDVSGGPDNFRRNESAVPDTLRRNESGPPEQARALDRNESGPPVGARAAPDTAHPVDRTESGGPDSLSLSLSTTKTTDSLRSSLLDKRQTGVVEKKEENEEAVVGVVEGEKTDAEDGRSPAERRAAYGELLRLGYPKSQARTAAAFPGVTAEAVCRIWGDIIAQQRRHPHSIDRHPRALLYDALKRGYHPFEGEGWKTEAEREDRV